MGILPLDFAFSSIASSDHQQTGKLSVGLYSVKSLNDSLLNCLTNKDLVSAEVFSEKLLKVIKDGNNDNASFSESFYLVGVYFATVRDFKKAINYLNMCIALKEKVSEYDRVYMRAFYNLSVAYSNLGNFKKFEYNALKSLEIGKKIYGDSHQEVLYSYYSLGSAYIAIKEYEKALTNMNNALRIANEKPDGTPAYILAGIYNNIGVCYSQLGDFSKAKIYFEKTELFHIYAHEADLTDYINLLNNLAATYNSLGLKSESAAYYDKGVKLTLSDNSNLDYNIINSYSIFLSNSNKTLEGERLLKVALDRAENRFGTDNRLYYEVLSNYAGYLVLNKMDIIRALKYYEKCLEYVRNNDQDTYLKNKVIKDYSMALDASGEPVKALENIQTLLFSYQQKPVDYYNNPSIENLKPDILTLKTLKVKYNILWNIYRKTADMKAITAASNTSRLIVMLLDKVRVNISEEESRLILGDKYRDSYLDVIRDINMLYKKTGDKHYLETLFEYSEKSKVAGLLASARELKAAQLHIPADMGNFEKELQREINLYDVKIAEATSMDNPNTDLILDWKESLLEAIRKRDSLILVFEKKYPDYYAIKYNTSTISMKDIPDVVGRNGNYVNYILSDTLLYTFVVNRKHQELLIQHIDSSFFSDIKRFRILLSKPSPTDDASLNFKEFQTTGYRLYKILVEPVRSYLVSERVVISPDNFLSYLPFESFPTNLITTEGIRYKELNYLMNDLDISYTYSATFMSETRKKDNYGANKLIAFAPDYPESIDIQTVMSSRQGGMGTLNDLPFARLEAEYVSGITGGTLFENKDALESVFKNESGKYDIIHLAMHTLLNDTDPMRSTLIFSHANDSTEDGYLKTFEIYGIPLKAKMVVLSSCNTGIGMLYSGEGILSLARGFIYSGSLSVVMSMWEIEDKSGTDVVKMFYDNLEKGYSKSVSLKRARSAFLKNADQLRSHPYFWSSLVVYGNDSALYHHNKLKIGLALILIIVIILTIIYYRKRKYS